MRDLLKLIGLCAMQALLTALWLLLVWNFAAAAIPEICSSFETVGQLLGCRV